MSQTFTNCDAGTWYAFNDTNLNIGQTVQVQFGAWDNSTNLDIYLARPGGSLVQSLVLNAGFGRKSDVYRLYNSSSTCELDQLNLTIPNDAGVATNDFQTFQFGVFNASVPLGQNGNALSGFLGWSPNLVVWNNATTTTTSSAAPTTSTTSAATAATTKASSATTTTSSASSDNSSGGLSSGAKAGIGIGVALGGILLAALIVGLWFWNRRRQRSVGGAAPDAAMGSFTKSPGPGSDGTGQGFSGAGTNTNHENLHELPPAANQQTEKGYYQSVPQQPAVHEMPSHHQAYEMA